MRRHWLLGLHALLDERQRFGRRVTMLDTVTTTQQVHVGLCTPHSARGHNGTLPSHFLRPFTVVHARLTVHMQDNVVKAFGGHMHVA
jgi:hypothetical protein